MKDYYAILELPRSATTDEIRSTYRRLVQQYHPDVNPDPSALELIKDINEAYEVLGDRNKKRGYDYLLDHLQANMNIEEPKPPHRDPAYNKRRNYPPVQSEESRLQEFMGKWIPFTTKIAWVGCIVCVFLLLDFLLPRQITGAQVRTFKSNKLPRAQSGFIVTASGTQLKISGEDMTWFNKGQLIEVIESRILSIVIEVRIPEVEKKITNLSTVYQNYFFVPVLLMIFSLLGLVVKEGVESRFNLGIVICFLLIFTLIVTFK